MKLALLRHGPTEWNAQGRIQGHTDIPLSSAGRAKLAALRLPDTLVGSRVFSSPLLRARQTAQALDLADPMLDARLMEQNWGRWEGLTRAQILERYGADAFEKAGASRREEFRPPGGESTGEVHARVAAFLRDISRDEASAVAVAHMGVLRAAYALATGWTMDSPMPARLDVSRILVLELLPNGEPAIAALNVEFTLGRTFTPSGSFTPRKG